jgi:SAM-dependent methyltransferase
MTALDCWFEPRLDEKKATGDLLEFGCGRTFRLTRLLGDRFQRLWATDVDAVEPEDVPDRVVFRRCTTRELPFDSEKFDVVVIRSVVEHLEDPAATFRDLCRVVRPGGYLLMNLPNKWDYVSVIARLSGGLKSTILKRVVRTRWEDFPVLYRCNTRRSLRNVVVPSGWDIEQFRPLPSQPSYLSFFVPFYVLGAIYQFGISIFALDALQPSFVVMLRKRFHHEGTTGTP